MKQLRRSRILACLMAIALGACSTGDATDPDGGGGGGGGGTPTITLTLSASTLSIVQAATGTLVASIARAGGFTGSVTIEVTGVPAGMTATPSPSSIPSNATSSTITVSPGASVQPGTYTLTVRASGTGVSAVTATFQVTVTAASQGDFTLTISPASGSIQQGQQTTATVNINRTGGFSGSVDLAVSGGPGAGLTATLDPASTTGNTSTLTMAAAGTLAAGTYNLTVTGNASGLSQQAASFALTVTMPPGGGGGNTTWSYCPNELPTWFAYQDGTGPWMQVQPVNSSFTFPINSGRGGVAVVTNATNLLVFYGTQQELDLFGMQCGMTPAPTKTVNGSVAGLAPTDNAFVTLGGASASVTGLGSPNFTLTGVQEGSYDLVASRSTLTVSGQNVFTQLAKLIIRRGLNPPNGTTLPVLDFNSTEAFDPVTRNVTINNLGADLALINAFYITGGTGVATLYTDINQTAGANRQYYGVPNANRASGDVHYLNVSAFTGMTFTDYRTASAYFAEATDRSITLGPTISGLNVTTVNSTPYARFRAQYTVQPEYDDLIIFGGGQNNGRSFTIFASKDYTGGATTYDFAIPDFTSTGGWMDTYGPQPGVQTSWTFSATGYNMPGGLITPQTDGVIAQGAVSIGQITP